ncbi:MAG: response regulator [Anaerolineae bacterium]|nr:response regulator [Anaerolineae bacterium]
MKKILVVEDASALRRDIIEMLGYEGFHVEGAENGQEGVERARHYRPDLIICDIMMPVMDGFDMLRELRKDQHTATIPFIFLTARAERMDMRQGMELGADDYVTKPFTASELIKTVQTRLEKHAIVTEKAEKKMRELRNNVLLALPHELRTPLNVILGFSDLLTLDAESIKPPRISEISGYINHAALRLYRLIENYLLYMQLELVSHDRVQQRILRNGVTANPSSAITDQACHWALNPHAPTGARKADLTLNIGESKSLAIGEEYLNKIVEELVDNACKFSAPGTPIKVEGKQNEKGYTFSVADQGIGMTTAQIDTIDAYIQFDRDRMEQQGTGLGLTICRLLAELHNGTFTVSSEPEVGTKVTIFLPYAPEA